MTGIILLLVLGSVYGEDNTTVLINDTSTVNTLNTEKTFEDFQNIIDNSSENDIIEVNDTYISTGNHIVINKNITVTGKSIFDGNNLSGVFNITSNNSKVKFENLTFINGKTKTAKYIANSIGIINSNSHIELINCNFISNNGLLINSNTLTCTDTTFENNFDELISTKNMNLTNCNIINNNLSEGIFNYDGDMNITNCTFSNNKISGYLIYSGAYFSYDDPYSTFNDYSNYISNSKFINNTRVLNQSRLDDELDDPTLIATYYKTNTICNSSFINNEDIEIKTDDETTLINNNTFENTTCRIWGKSEIENCIFKNTLSLALQLGKSYDKYYEWEWNWGPSNSKIINSTFLNNHYAIFSENNLNIKNSLFKNNYGESSGAIKLYWANKLIITNTTFKNNTNAAIDLIDEDSLGLEKTRYYIKIDGKKYSSTILDDNLKEMKIITTTLKNTKIIHKSKDKLKIKLINRFTKKPIYKAYMAVEVLKGKKSIDTFFSHTNSKGIATIDLSNINIGTYKLKITFEYSDCAIKMVTSKIKIVKAKANVKAPQVTSKYKQSKDFKITIKHSKTKKPLKTALKVKIGKKTYKINTNSKGIAKFNTKNLNKGTYKVTINSGNKNFIISSKSKIIIK